ncbi:hypothetical protein LJ739_03260 [Aestuariibacter halophilus]|uniref:Lipoprotein n=1 Tax=Fluctibacter halophilus TaxID=226011 RepID=A0ABS8G7P9_9ALTE|nr:hypothetical protein [Aestuariibacter halophilus]MCC2615256.1 hypothetical protein [Aestuariibacter halophilus]
MRAHTLTRLILFTTLAMLSGCVQDLGVHIPRFADKSALTVSDNTLKSVNRVFYASFMAGNWYYKGARVRNGIVSAYIQIPQKLDMPEDVQHRYVKQVLCPKADAIDMWNQLRHVNLEVHLYTYSQRQSVSASCPNPLFDRA